MPLSREEVEQIAKSSAQAVLEGLHRYAVEYKEPDTVEQGLQDSMIEERTAADWYRKRAKNAADYHVDGETMALYQDIAVDEDEHYSRLNDRLQKLTKELETVSLQPVRDYWDTYLENNPLRMVFKDTDAAAFLTTMIEAAGDILREYCGKRDGGYMMEKLRYIERGAKGSHRDWVDLLATKESEKLGETRKLLEGLPVRDQITALVKSLLVSICDRTANRVEFFLNQLEPLLKSTKPKLPAGGRYLRQQGEWVYAKVGYTEMQGRKSPNGIEFVQVSSAFDQNDLDEATRMIEEFFGKAA